MNDPSQPIDIPAYVAEYQDSLTFVQKLMFMLFHAEDKSAILVLGQKGIQRPPIAWAHEGKAIMIFDKEVLVSHWFPLFFNNCSKYKSFTRNLYRWGFKRVPLQSSLDTKRIDNVECFKNIYFQRNNTGLLHCMENVTAEKLRARNARRVEGVQQLQREEKLVHPAPSDEDSPAIRAKTSSSQRRPDDVAAQIVTTEPNKTSDSLSSDLGPIGVLGYPHVTVNQSSKAIPLLDSKEGMFEITPNTLLLPGPGPNSTPGIQLPATHDPSLYSMSQEFEDCDLDTDIISSLLEKFKSSSFPLGPPRRSTEMESDHLPPCDDATIKTPPISKGRSDRVVSSAEGVRICRGKLDHRRCSPRLSSSWSCYVPTSQEDFPSFKTRRGIAVLRVPRTTGISKQQVWWGQNNYSYKAYTYNTDGVVLEVVEGIASSFTVFLFT